MKWFLIFLPWVLWGQIHQVKDLVLFQETIEELSQQSLVIVDVDYTLFMPEDPLFHPKNSQLRQKVVFEQFGTTWNALDPLRKSRWMCSRKIRLVNPKLVELLADLKERGIPTIIMTLLKTGSYGEIDSLEEWRLAELASLHVPLQTPFPLFSSISFPELFSSKATPRYVSGVVFTAGQSKKKCLEVLLDRVGFSPEKLVMLDDSLSQVEQMETGLYPFVGFHYCEAEQGPVPQCSLSTFIVN